MFLLWAQGFVNLSNPLAHVIFHQSQQHFQLIEPAPHTRHRLYPAAMEGTRYSSPSVGDLTSYGTASRPVKIIQLQHPSTSASAAPSSSFFEKWKAKVKRMTWTEWIQLFLPCYRWISTYKWREYLQPDLMAGITVGVMLVPQVLKTYQYLNICIYVYSPVFIDDNLCAVLLNVQKQSMSYAKLAGLHPIYGLCKFPPLLCANVVPYIESSSVSFD